MTGMTHVPHRNEQVKRRADLEILVCEVTAKHVIIASFAGKRQESPSTDWHALISEQNVFALTMLYHLLSMFDAVCSACLASKVFPVADLHKVTPQSMTFTCYFPKSTSH